MAIEIPFIIQFDGWNVVMEQILSNEYPPDEWYIDISEMSGLANHKVRLRKKMGNETFRWEDSKYGSYDVVWESKVE